MREDIQPTVPRAVSADSPGVAGAAAVGGRYGRAVAPPPLNDYQHPGLFRSTSADGAHHGGRRSGRSSPAHSEASTTVTRFGLLEAPHSMLTPEGCPELQMPLCAASNGLAKPPPSPAFASGWSWRRLLEFTGPGWLMSIAYVDPGNLEADLQSGAQFGYLLLWALAASTGLGLCMQLVAARLGCASRRHLAEHCRDRYQPRFRVVLWMLTELAVVGSDIQEVIGSSIGLQILFGFPLSVGVLVTAGAAFLFLFLERLGTRPLELFFGALILVLAVTMGGLFAAVAPDKGAMVEAIIMPRMPASSVQQVVGMVGCIVMPHNLFLHSALVQSRVVRRGEEREAVALFTIESSAAIATSLLINMSVVAVFAKGFHGTEGAADIGLASAGTYLGKAFGEPLKIVWALGLCAAGQSSTMTGAYAGQWVMQGYLQLKAKPWKRALVTRSMALVPTLIVAIYFGGAGGDTGLDVLNSYLNVLQSLVLPFTLVPLLTFAGSSAIMGELVLSPVQLVSGWAATVLVMIANMYLLAEQLGPFLHLTGLLFGGLLYVAAVVYAGVAPRPSCQESAAQEAVASLER